MGSTAKGGAYGTSVQRDAHDFMRFSFYFWSFAEIADIYFLWFIKFFSSGISSKKGVPIYIRFYSFTPGYSKDHDEETFIPVETFLNLKPGYQEVLLEPSKLTVPTWWREDYKDFKEKKGVKSTIDPWKIKKAQ